MIPTHLKHNRHWSRRLSHALDGIDVLIFLAHSFVLTSTFPPWCQGLVPGSTCIPKCPLMAITCCRRSWVQECAHCVTTQPAELDLLMPRHNHGRGRPFGMHRGWSWGWDALLCWQRGNGGHIHNTRVTEPSPSSKCSSGTHMCQDLDADLSRDPTEGWRVSKMAIHCCCCYCCSASRESTSMHAVPSSGWQHALVVLDAARLMFHVTFVCYFWPCILFRHCVVQCAFPK